MLRHTLVDSALNRLSAHFASRVVVHPPACADRLAELEHVAGPLPRELTILLATCDGLRIDAEGREADLQLWGSQQILSSVVGPSGPAVPMDLLPIRGDPTGERDWIVMGHGPAGGAVVRWDPWVPGCSIIASNLGAYLVGWADYLVERYAGDGKDRARGTTKPLCDTSFLRTHDKDLAALQADPRVAEWLHSVDHAVACGDDYE